MQEQTSWSSTAVVLLHQSSADTNLSYVEVLLFLGHALSVDEHKHSQARMRYSKFVHYYVQNYRHRTYVIVCWLPKFHGFNLAPLFH